MFRAYKATPIKQPTALKIALVGSAEAKNTFLKKLNALTQTENTSGFLELLGVDFISATINNQDYIFWNLHLINDNKAVLDSAFDGANAILFCNASQAQQAQVINTLDGDRTNLIHIKTDQINLSHFFTDLNKSIQAQAAYAEPRIAPASSRR